MESSIGRTGATADCFPYRGSGHATPPRAAGNPFHQQRIFLLWDFYNKPVPALPKSYGAVAMLIAAASLIRRADGDIGGRSGRRLI
jgi:hypothetical protein